MQVHIPVLLNEVIENLNINEDSFLIDATFGRGGHTREILKCLGKKGRLLVIDKDLSAIESAQQIQDERLIIKHGSYALVHKFTDELGVTGKVNGILLDLGVSSPQLDVAERGFSFLQDGPLDMRMDKTQALTAEIWVNSVSEREMADVFWKYGEERFSRRIARAVCEERLKGRICSTSKLAEIVSKAHPRWEKHKHPATRVFQAIRIVVNDELSELKVGLEESFKVLAPKGRLLVITFHSLEDRIVKDFVRKNSGDDVALKDLPLLDAEIKRSVKVVGKPIFPSGDEIFNNQRARSAKLRIMEKIV